MTEKLTPAKAVFVNYACDECGGLMTAMGVVNMSYPATYPHTCPNGHKAALMHRYPVVRIIDDVMETEWGT